MTATMVYFKILFTLCCCSNLIFVRTHEYDGDEYADVEADDDLANYLKEAIENLRSQMTKGIPEINMPVLDPLHLEDMDIKVRENVASIDLQIQEMRIIGLSSFHIHDLRPNLEEFYVYINLTIPHIFFTGKYLLNGRIMSIFPINGDGNYTINTTHLNIGGSGQLRFVQDTMQMDLMNLDIHFEKITMDLGRNFLGGGRFGEVMQEVIPGVGRDVFMIYKPLLLKQIELALTKEINLHLQKPEVKDIIKGIIPS